MKGTPLRVGYVLLPCGVLLDGGWGWYSHVRPDLTCLLPFQLSLPAAACQLVFMFAVPGKTPGDELGPLTSHMRGEKHAELL